jgi:dUTPase
MLVFENPTTDPNILTKLLSIYNKIMVLKVFVDGDDDLKQKYIEAVKNHNSKIVNQKDVIDAGFDLITPSSLDNNDGSTNCYYPLSKIDFKIKCSATMHTIRTTNSTTTTSTGYYMYPRSSLSKTKLRLANATGIIDAGYRGNLIGMFDVLKHTHNINSDNNYPDYVIQKYDRLLQICAPGLVPIVVEIVNNSNQLGGETERGVNGLGSSGR